MAIRVSFIVTIVIGLLSMSVSASEKGWLDEWKEEFDRDSVDCVSKTRQIVRAHIVGRALARYEQQREQASANDTVVWNSSWIIDAGIMLTDSCLYPSLDSLVVIKTVESGFYYYDDSWGVIKENCWSPDPTWFVGFIRDGGSYVLNGEQDGQWGSELSALIEHIREQPRTDSLLWELTRLYYDLYSWDKEYLYSGRLRTVSNFAEVRTFFEYEDSVLYSQLDSDDELDSYEEDSSEWDEEFAQFVADTSSVLVRGSIHPPMTEKIDGGDIITIFVVCNSDCSVMRVVARISDDLKFELISHDRVI